MVVMLERIMSQSSKLLSIVTNLAVKMLELA